MYSVRSPLMLNDSSSAHSMPKYSRPFSLEVNCHCWCCMILHVAIFIIIKLYFLWCHSIVYNVIDRCRGRSEISSDCSITLSVFPGCRQSVLSWLPGDFWTNHLWHHRGGHAHYWWCGQWLDRTRVRTNEFRVQSQNTTRAVLILDFSLSLSAY